MCIAHLLQGEAPSHILNNCFHVKKSFGMKFKRKLWAFISYMCCYCFFFLWHILNYESLKKFCLTCWYVTFQSGPVSTMRNSCELNALDWYELKLRLTVCPLHADWNKNFTLFRVPQELFQCLNSAAFNYVFVTTGTGKFYSFSLTHDIDW
jgi:hypothetical protein